MIAAKRHSLNSKKVLCIILGGGQGTRLFPLTKDRSEPAVPLGGKYRLVDIPISNCINSGYNRIFILTQFNSASLHRHISQSYKFDDFTNGFVEILAAEQTIGDTTWYQGTADAVRKNKAHLMAQDFEYVLILSSDQLYRMDFRDILAQHIETESDLTVASIPVGRAGAQGLGIMQIDDDLRIDRFIEKPSDPAILDSLCLPKEWYAKLGVAGEEEYFLASMGIYVFGREMLFKMLDNDSKDFGKHIIPGVIQSHRVFSYVFQGYWEDIGTIRTFFDANLELTAESPRFDFFAMESAVFTRPQFLPASKINGAEIDHCVISDGCIINHSKVAHSIVGIRSLINRGCHLNRVIMLGSDYFESESGVIDKDTPGIPRIGIGENTRIENAIIDKNARIGSNCVISPVGKPDNVTEDFYFIRDGIVIIPRNGIVPDGTVI
jgi:glucose-1-phosphate adenylyltransferase